MKKEGLIARVSEKADLSRVEAKKVVEAVLESIESALSEGTEVRLAGFGSFLVLRRAARRGRNPRTGEAISIKASNRLVFRPGNGLKDAVNFSGDHGGGKNNGRPRARGGGTSGGGGGGRCQ